MINLRMFNPLIRCSLFGYSCIFAGIASIMNLFLYEEIGVTYGLWGIMAVIGFCIMGTSLLWDKEQ